MPGVKLLISKKLREEKKKILGFTGAGNTPESKTKVLF